MLRSGMLLLAWIMLSGGVKADEPTGTGEEHPFTMEEATWSGLQDAWEVLEAHRAKHPPRSTTTPRPQVRPNPQKTMQFTKLPVQSDAVMETIAAVYDHMGAAEEREDSVETRFLRALIRLRIGHICDLTADSSIAIRAVALQIRPGGPGRTFPGRKPVLTMADLDTLLDTTPLALETDQYEAFIDQMVSLGLIEESAPDWKKMRWATLVARLHTGGAYPQVLVADNALVAEIDTLIEQLGSTDFEVRTEATRRLTEIGPAAFSQLRACENHDNPTIRNAVRGILGD